MENVKNSHNVLHAKLSKPQWLWSEWEAAADEITGKLPRLRRLMLDESQDPSIQFISSGSYGTIKTSVPIIQCGVCSNDSQFSAVWTQKPPNCTNTSTVLFTLFWLWNIKLDRFCLEPYLVLFHRYLWPSHLGSFAFLLLVRPAARTQSRAATKQPTDGQLVVTTLDIPASSTPQQHLMLLFFCFKAKLFS